MTTAEPHLPNSDDGREQIPAADPGSGAPANAPGTGIGGEEPDTAEADSATAPDPGPVDTPFRTPVPPEH